jgi:hypothetical protein
VAILRGQGYIIQAAKKKETDIQPLHHIQTETIFANYAFYPGLILSLAEVTVQHP